MRSLAVASWLCVAMASAPATAGGFCWFDCKPAPAPEIGAGVPVALAIGGVLLGVMFLTRRRKS
jgi:hypothetical protein